jgi:hypothetical protein
MFLKKKTNLHRTKKSVKDLRGERRKMHILADRNNEARGNQQLAVDRVRLEGTINRVQHFNAMEELIYSSRNSPD